MRNTGLMPLVRWMKPLDCGPSSPGGCSSIFLMCGAQLGHCSTRVRCSHALCKGTATVNSYLIKATISPFFHLQQLLRLTAQVADLHLLEPVGPGAARAENFQAVGFFDPACGLFETPARLGRLVEAGVGHGPEQPVPGPGHKGSGRFVKAFDCKLVPAGAAQSGTEYAVVSV